MVAPNRPFRLDLVRRDELGSLLDGTDAPDLWFPRPADPLAEAVAVVELGRTAEVRQRMAHLLSEAPSAAERWSRDLRTELRRP